MHSPYYKADETRLKEEYSYLQNQVNLIVKMP